MTVPSMLLQKLTCNTVLTSLSRLATNLASQSVQRRLKLCTSQPPGKTYAEPNITINEQWLNAVDKFTHLGSTLSRNVVIDDEVNARLAKASAAFSRLNKNVWARKDITLETKIKVYQAIVLTTLLYGCQSWTVYQCHTIKLNHFHTTCIRKLLGIKWQDKIPDTEVLRCASLPSIYTILMQSQLHWAGHVVCMPDHWLPNRLFYGKLQQGKHSWGGHKKHYKDTLKVSLKAFDISTDTLDQTVQDGGKWWASVHKGAKTCEANRIAAAEQCRQVRKKQCKQIPNSSHHSLSKLPENLLGTNWPGQPSSYPQKLTPPPGGLDGPHHFQWTNEEVCIWIYVCVFMTLLGLQWVYMWPPTLGLWGLHTTISKRKLQDSGWKDDLTVQMQTFYLIPSKKIPLNLIPNPNGDGGLKHDFFCADQNISYNS